jgi:hypothetical protein
MRRRNLLKATLAGSLFLPFPWVEVWAQDPREGALRLVKAPKLALVVGNGGYKDAPVLKNAPNDAKAIADSLKAAGFAVAMKLDTPRDELLKAIRDHVHAMEAQKAVGLFYFAGHGVQLDWRNYMLPIDAVIDKVEDVARQSVDVARLMEGLAKAANPMNVIILDACRENPFGDVRKGGQKGLSQMDAPIRTLLAYATSPGNVASDGDGANGLYTEHLLREMKVPEAKIEDVFKRVRLGVRLKSNGAQVPWESTSLEDDYWFIPPKELKRQSDVEKERLFKAELALWERIKDATDAAPLEAYLKERPSGFYSELVQLRLDRILASRGEKKAEIASQSGNPYTQGTVAANTGFKIGDSYDYVTMEPISRVERRRFTSTVTKVAGNEIHYSNGRITDLLGNVIVTNDGRGHTGYQNFPTEFAIGKQWSTRYLSTSPRENGEGQVDFRIVRRESITVPAGTFQAYLIEGRGETRWDRGGVRQGVQRFWMAPDRVRVAVAQEERWQYNNGNVAPPSYRQELLSFKEG